MKLFVSLLLSFAAFKSNATDLGPLQNCLKKGYQPLTNRHAIVAAVLDGESSQIMTFGAGSPSQIFEIGSLTKTFTAQLLAQAVVAGATKLSDAIPDAYQKSGATITFAHLTTHTSGIIAGIFPGFHVVHPLTPFDGLTVPVFRDLYSQTPLDSPPGTKFSYSNLGVSLLGLILSEKTAVPYETLIQNRIFKLLGMTDTYFKVPDTALARFPEGYMGDTLGHTTHVPHWDLYKTAIDPAGGIRSTISDMIKYARANLVPESSRLRTAVQLSQQKLFQINDHNMWIGMNWIIQPDLGLIWHNGATYGFNSILAISKKRRQAIVAMADTTVMKLGEGGQRTPDDALQDVAFSCLK